MIENFVDNLAKLLPFGYAFGLGMVTAVSPCSIAMLPAYISLHLATDEKGYWDRSWLWRFRRALMMSGVMTLGFVLLFGLVGAALSPIGELLKPYVEWVGVVIAILLILLGVYVLVGGRVYANLPARLANKLSQSGSVGVRGFLVFGIAYGLAALSCSVLLFTGMVVGAYSSGGFANALLQFILFALGMGLVITVVTIASALIRETVNRWLHRLVPVVARLSGLLLIFAGGYMIYYWFVVGDILGG
ncbi:MAG: sulfite exporter TauE/SafE family protein [Dehalococcoidales bacterium]|nr:MAG: sulfite exporter TauE/SafE family protein [Dehalococcoidales bacterium]